jgi:hypothetical protein
LIGTECSHVIERYHGGKRSQRANCHWGGLAGDVAD